MLAVILVQVKILLKKLTETERDCAISKFCNTQNSIAWCIVRLPNVRVVILYSRSFSRLQQKTIVEKFCLEMLLEYCNLVNYASFFL